MQNRKPLLSICIPTYNRCRNLIKALESYVNCEGFDSEVEIVISDNASSDNTQDVCIMYSKKYENIHYYRNDENLYDSNFSLALDRGHGSYLKLMNDTHIVSNDFLIYLKKSLKAEINTQIPVFFTFGTLFNQRKRNRIVCASFSDYVKYVSYFVTANQLFGVWHEDWLLVKDRLRFTHLRLNQVDWTYQILELKGRAVLYTGTSFDVDNPGIRKGYNWFEVHVDNYYKIMQEYINKGLISHDALMIEKKTYLKGLKAEMLMAIGYNVHDDWDFDLEGSYVILWNHFKKIPYYYYTLLTMPLWGVKYILYNKLKSL